jgi:ubiquinone/menaquinone biosynthesis C-methylase UbiE
MWNKGWDNIFKTRDWGKYPDLSIVRFASKYFKNADKKKINILELGCGIGANLFYFAKENYSTYGIDGSQVAIDIAKKRFRKEKIKANFFQGDIIRLPFSDNSFDCVIDCECLYSNSTADTKIICKEIFRILKNKGIFFSKTFATETYGYKKGKIYKNEKNTFINLKTKNFHKGYGIIRFMSLDDIKKIYLNDFRLKDLNYEVRTFDQTKKKIKEWIIILQKIIK